MIHLYRSKKHLREGNASSKLAKELGITSFCSPTTPPDYLYPRDTIINWGRSARPSWLGPANVDWEINWINLPERIAYCANKIKMLEVFRGSGIPCYEVIPQEEMAPGTIYSGDVMACGRKLIASHSGKGIVFIENEETIPEGVKLWVKAAVRETEARAFVVNGEVVAYAQKKRMGAAKLAQHGIAEADPLIKSLPKGWVYAKKDIRPLTPMAKIMVIEAIGAMGLDFGAVDFAYNENMRDLIVIETNSSPGLSSPTTLAAVAAALKEMI